MRLALIGFGTVGQGLAEILRTKGKDLAERYGFEASIVAVATLHKGSIYHPDGLDLDQLLTAIRSGDLSQYPDQPGLMRGLSPLDTIQESNADTVIEVTLTDFKTAEPALSHVKAAFAANKNVITANKGPIALAYSELLKTSLEKDLFFGFEGTIMSGTPVLRMARVALAGCTIRGARGILNSTTNFILTKMEHGANYADALAEAQRLGYAEADPSGDVEGFDAAGKLIIVAQTVFNTSLKLEDIERTGITGLTPQDIEFAKASGGHWKLIAQVIRDDAGKIKASVMPTFVPNDDPLSAVAGVTNAITFETDLMGPITINGAGAGSIPTGYAVLSDLLALHGVKPA